MSARPRVSLIAALARNRVIGRENQLPWRLPEDLKRFKSLTMGHPILMGRKTFDSIGKPLPGRLNVVISRSPAQTSSSPDEWVHAGSLDEAFEKAFAVPTDEVFVIGGAQIYELALPRADRLYLTLIDEEVPGDAYFPSWDAGTFREIEREDRTDPRRFSFVTLERKG